MKRIIKYTIIVAIALFAVDYLVGIIGEKLRTSAKGGDTARFEYINHGTRDSVLIFGSSRAVHHYVPTILEDSLGVSVYNAGADGNGIILAYMQLQSLLQHHKPALIIYDVYPPFDLSEGDNSKYLGRQRYFYGEASAVDSVFWRISPTERVKMLSNMYRYNSDLLQLVADYISPKQSDIKGYRPQIGTSDFKIESDKPFSLDSVKVDYFNRFVDLCRTNNIRLELFFSPRYYGDNQTSEGYAVAKKLAAQKGMTIHDYLVAKPFDTDKSLFKDSQHLNDDGARKYTSMIVKDL